MDRSLVHHTFNWCAVALHSLILQGGEDNTGCWSLCLYSVILEAVVGHKLMINHEI